MREGRRELGEERGPKEGRGMRYKEQPRDHLKVSQLWRPHPWSLLVSINTLTELVLQLFLVIQLFVHL